MSALSHECGQLLAFNLSDCQGITVIGMSAMRVIMHRSLMTLSAASWEDRGQGHASKLATNNFKTVS
jgi:hypothetical protein